ncbi:MAG: hypothetical protein WD042_00915 [Phycisphaeraceae bacterium]
MKTHLTSVGPVKTYGQDVACLTLLAAVTALAVAAPCRAQDQADTWAFDPPVDAFSDQALLDLRRLNEKQAGESGFIKLSSDGMSFVRGDGQPIRFWATGSDGYNLSPQDMQRHARTLAKMGVNMVRLHVTLANTKEGAKITDVDDKLIDNIQRFVGVCKANGIYVTISPYYGHFKLPRSWGVEGYDGDTQPWGLLFFNPTLEEAWKGWIKELYTRPNPHSGGGGGGGGGTPLKDEPAVALIQVQNEDSLLFWTSQAIKPAQQRLLGKRWGDYLAKKYGSLDNAVAAWGGVRLRDGQAGVVAGLGDDVNSGTMGMYIIWELTQSPSGNKAKRIADQTEFMARLERDFYADAATWYRQIGCKQLTNAGNWKTADADKLDDLQRWTYAGCDVIAVNRYTGGQHNGDNNGYRIDPGHRIADFSVMKNPLTLPTNLKQVVGHPMAVTETTWVQPNLYQSEGAFLVAAYQSLSGVDVSYWFASGEPDWMRDPRRKWWHVDRSKGESGYALHKWTNQTPTLMGSWPANALLFRLGYLQQGQTVVHEERALAELFDRKSPVVNEATGFDPNRDAVDLRARAGEAAGGAASRLAFLVGPVQVVYGGDPAKSRIADLSRHIDGTKKTVRSNTGQIAWDWGTGVCTINAPKAQGVAGFLKDAGGKFDLADVTIESRNDYATVQLVAMDDRPLRQSARILVQVNTTARLTGWETRPVSIPRQGGPAVQGQEIVATGHPPYQVADTHVTLRLNNAGITKATLLDAAGYASGDVALQKDADRTVIQLPRHTMYLILH